MINKGNEFIALIVAGGSGSRFNKDTINDDYLPKQYKKINNKPILWHSINAFAQTPEVDEIHIVLAPDDKHWLKILSPEIISLEKKIKPHFCGGNTRSQSVLNGLKNIESNDNAWVMVHDAARPCVRVSDLQKIINILQANQNCEDNVLGAILATPVADTLKKSLIIEKIRNGEKNIKIETTVNRADLWQAQTPQVFRKSILEQAINLFANETDEASSIEKLIKEIKEFNQKVVLLVEGSRDNIKVTYKEDYKIAEAILG